MGFSIFIMPREFLIPDVFHEEDRGDERYGALIHGDDNFSDWVVGWPEIPEDPVEAVKLTLIGASQETCDMIKLALSPEPEGTGGCQVGDYMVAGSALKDFIDNELLWRIITHEYPRISRRAIT